MNIFHCSCLHLRIFAALMIALFVVGDPSTGAADGKVGMTVHRDPETGQFVEPPRAGPDRDTAVGEKAPLPELVQRTNPVGGGVTVHLNGQFRSTLRVTRGADGHPSVDCIENGTVHPDHTR